MSANITIGRVDDSNSTFIFTIPMAGNVKEVKINVDDLLSINEIDLRDALASHATYVGWIGILQSHYQKLYQAEKDHLKVLEAELYKEKKQTLNESGERVTENLIKSEVNSDPRYVRQMASVRDAEFNLNIITSIRKALDHKRDALVQIAGIMKKELEAS